MPTKKAPKKKPTQKQKQKQSQSIKVVVNVPETKKAKRKPRKKRSAATAATAAPVDYKAFPPQIIYPSEPRRGEYGTIGIMEAPRVPVGLSISQKIPETTGLFEDVGSTGSSQILEVPTKKEQLADIGDVVPLKPEPVSPSLEKVAKSVYAPKSFADVPMVGMSSFDLFSPMSSKSFEDEFTVRNPMLTEEFGLKKRAPRRAPSPNPRDFTPTGLIGVKRDSKQDLITRYNRLTDQPLPPNATVKMLKGLVRRMEDL